MPADRPDAKTLLELQFHEMRWRLLSLAADFDRLDRAGGLGDLDDERLDQLHRAAEVVFGDEPDRAEQVQLIFSDLTEEPTVTEDAA